MKVPQRTTTLKFDADKLQVGDRKDVREGLSALAVSGNTLWIANDEALRLEQFRIGSDGDFKAHRTIALLSCLDLPAGAGEEADIEGLDVEGGYLWLIGSHSLKRGQPKPGKKLEENLARLTRITADGNRYLLARIPLVEKDGLHEPQPQGMHRETGTPLTARRLEGDTQRNQLIDALREDAHLGRYLEAPPAGDEAGSADPGIPGKDNGFDVEGLAACEGRLFIGLRGPVLRGWAIVLEVRISEGAAGLLELAPFPDGRRYRKHFLQLGGLGIRELVLDGKDLLVLAGPTMDLDGPVWLYRWKHAVLQEADSVTWNADLQRVWRTPNGEGCDHAEGVAVITAADGTRRLLVTYDSPDPWRLGKDGEYYADLFEV